MLTDDDDTWGDTEEEDLTVKFEFTTRNHFD